MNIDAVANVFFDEIDRLKKEIIRLNRLLPQFKLNSTDKKYLEDLRKLANEDKEL